MEFKDYYKILEIDKNATLDQIKKSYRKLARKYHPDINNAADAESRFKEIGEAYEVLKDPEKRKLYDRYGADWKTGKEREEFRNKYREPYQQPSGQGEAGFDFSGAYENEGQFSDFFEMLFGGVRKGPHSATSGKKQKGDDVHASIDIPLEDVFHGATRQITFETKTISPDGQVSIKPISLKVKIPIGIKEGQKIRLAGQGSPGYNGGEPGDMYIEIGFVKHPYFLVDGADLTINLPVAPWEAALGTSVTIPTPSGALVIKVPAGSGQGKKLRLKGKGIPAKEPGDLYIILNIVLPPADSDMSRKIYEEMKNLNFNPRANFGRA